MCFSVRNEHAVRINGSREGSSLYLTRIAQVLPASLEFVADAIPGALAPRHPCLTIRVEHAMRSFVQRRRRLPSLAHTPIGIHAPPCALSTRVEHAMRSFA